MINTVTLQKPDGHLQDQPKVEGNFSIDPDVLQHLPADAVTISVNSYGVSEWSTTACIDAELKDGKHKKYFFKTVKENPTEKDAAMIRGEYAAMSELYGIIPEGTPEIIKFKPDTNGNRLRPSILYDFLDLEERDEPHPDRLCALIVKLHKKSHSPTNEFGFYCPTPCGQYAQATAWKRSWKDFLVQLIKHTMDADREVNEVDREFEGLETKTLDHIIPRLIEPLELHGSIKPCLIHGDLWHGNTGVETGTKNVFLFDAGSYYAHHEMEMASRSWTHNKLREQDYVATYDRIFDEGAHSEPKEEWYSRFRLYSVHYLLMIAVNHTIKSDKGAEARKL